MSLTEKLFSSPSPDAAAKLVSEENVDPDNVFHAYTSLCQQSDEQSNAGSHVRSTVRKITPIVQRYLQQTDGGVKHLNNGITLKLEEKGAKANLNKKEMLGRMLSEFLRNAGEDVRHSSPNALSTAIVDFAEVWRDTNKVYSKKLKRFITDETGKDVEVQAYNRKKRKLAMMQGATEEEAEELAAREQAIRQRVEAEQY